VPDDLVDACSVAGPPGECAAKLAALAARGFGDVACWLFETTAVPHARMVERLVEEVVPQLRALEIAPAVGR
jgi:alkanesulfonate monooxygenase SsuD/methylene tetrahydromethanopterin reductase-like flavin-dependent oxidoreductase (luciferase family)